MGILEKILERELERLKALEGPATPMYADGDPRNKPAKSKGEPVPTPERAGLLTKIMNGTGIPERLDLLNDWFNPVEALRMSGEASRDMLAPGKHPWERVGSLGAMLTGMAGTVAPMYAASRGAMPAADAVMDGMAGFSAMPKAMAGEFLADDFGGLKLSGKKAEYPIAPRDEWWGDANYTATGGRMETMTPDEFLARARPMEIDDVARENIDDLKFHITSGKKLDPLAIWKNGKEDGRHRAYAAKELGIDRVPVLLWDDVSPPGITAYHGSPHSFDRFSMDKIGTGEGAQAYGHGLYFAESEGVATSYRDALALDAGFTYKGKTGLTRDQLAEEITKDFGGGYLDNVTTPRGVADGVMDELVYGPANRKLGPERAALREKLLAEIGRTDPGSMYEVRIKASPDDFLDWDKPLSEQPAKVREALGPLAETARREKYITGVDSGEDLYRGAVDGMMFDRKQIGLVAEKNAKDDIARLASERGIPGIKYLDAGSRNAGDGSRNYVVFDENLIEIVRKYGVAGAAAMLGVTAADIEGAMNGS